MSAVAGIVLAAGAGRRFGGPKALVAYDGELLVERAVRVASAGGCDPVLVVLGASADEVQERADLGSAVVVVAPDWERGMSASLQAGLAAVTTTGAAAAVVVLVDQPLVAPEVIERLRSAWGGGAVAAVAGYDGQLRNPALFDRSVWAEVSAAAHDDVGARPWLTAHRAEVTAVECADIASAADIDTPSDLDGLARDRSAGE